ncbi:MAG TPA: hypothetical protein PKV84_01610 [Candidatus Omnitrophota bacterium]|nr:hypothetical protein [Candidatus Omnitrophota bacterium]
MRIKRLTKKVEGSTAYIFTPLCHETGRRIKLWIKEAWTPRGKLVRFIVTDARTGKKYKAETAHCDLPGCICDAVIYGYSRKSRP